MWDYFQSKQEEAYRAAKEKEDRKKMKKTFK